VLELLARLVEQSLVEFDVDATRYRMLETVREYALERLAQSGAAAAVRSRHLAWCVRFAEAAANSAVAERGARLVAVDGELENLLAAHAWCDLDPDGGAQGLELAVPIARMNYWVLHGMPELGYRVMTEALARKGAQPRNLARCRALLGAAQVGYFIFRLDDAHAQAIEALGIAGEMADRQRMAGAHILLGGITYSQGDAVAAKEHFAAAIAIGRELDAPVLLCNALNDLAEIHHTEGNLDLAEAHYLESLALHPKFGLADSRAILLQNLARVAIDREQPDRAHAPLAESLDIADEQESTYLGLHSLEVACGLAALAGEGRLAARLHGAASRERERSGQRRLPADEAFLAHWVGRIREALGPTDFADADAAGRATEYREAIAAVRAQLGSPAASDMRK
jgi:tetratricopeptide (TPR) repeat protein